MMTEIGFPIYLSFKIALLATLIVLIVGLGLSWLFARARFAGKKLMQIIVNLPLVFPPSVLGYYLLLVFGRQGVVGSWLEEFFNIRLVFHWTGGILAAVVVSLPLFINTVRPAFANLRVEIIQAAKVDGGTNLQIFFKIILPLVRRNFLAGIALVIARSLGEFGTTLLLIGNIPQKTQTMSLAIYQAVLSGNYVRANQLVLIMTLIALGIMFLISQLETVD